MIFLGEKLIGGSLRNKIFEMECFRSHMANKQDGTLEDVRGDFEGRRTAALLTFMEGCLVGGNSGGARAFIEGEGKKSTYVSASKAYAMIYACSECGMAIYETLLAAI